MANNSSEGFLITANFYNNQNYAALVTPNNQNPKFWLAVNPEVRVLKKDKLQTNNM